MKVDMVQLLPFGGHHHYTAQLCKHLLTTGRINRITLINFFYSQIEERDILNSQIKFLSLFPFGIPNRSRLNKLFLLVFNHLRFCWRILRDSPNLVHIQMDTGYQLYNILFMLIYKMRRIPIIRTIHEVTFERHRRVGLLEFWLSYEQLKFVDKFIVHDAHTKWELMQRLKKSSKDFFIIPHGNYLFFRDFMVTEEKKRESENSLSVLFWGFKRHKGLETFLKAASELNEEGYKFKTIIAGTVGAFDEDLISKSRKLKNAELYPGYISNSQIWKYFVQSNFVVMPYILGTTSGAIHLSYAFKKPVIVSDLPCFKEVVIPNRTGLVIPKGDVKALKEAMIYLLEHRKEGERMGEEGYRFECSPEFDWGVIANRTIKIYEEALGEKKVKR